MAVEWPTKRSMPPNLLEVWVYPTFWDITEWQNWPNSQIYCTFYKPDWIQLESQDGLPHPIDLMWLPSKHHRAILCLTLSFPLPMGFHLKNNPFLNLHAYQEPLLLTTPFSYQGFPHNTLHGVWTRSYTKLNSYFRQWDQASQLLPSNAWDAFLLFYTLLNNKEMTSLLELYLKTDAWETYWHCTDSFKRNLLNYLIIWCWWKIWV